MHWYGCSKSIQPFPVNRHSFSLVFFPPKTAQHSKRGDSNMDSEVELLGFESFNSTSQIFWSLAGYATNCLPHFASLRNGENEGLYLPCSSSAGLTTCLTLGQNNSSHLCSCLVGRRSPGRPLGCVLGRMGWGLSKDPAWSLRTSSHVCLACWGFHPHLPRSLHPGVPFRQTDLKASLPPSRPEYPKKLLPT